MTNKEQIAYKNSSVRTSYTVKSAKIISLISDSVRKLAIKDMLNIMPVLLTFLLSFSIPAALSHSYYPLPR